MPYPWEHGSWAGRFSNMFLFLFVFWFCAAIVLEIPWFSARLHTAWTPPPPDLMVSPGVETDFQHSSFWPIPGFFFAMSAKIGIFRQCHKSHFCVLLVDLGDKLPYMTLVDLQTFQILIMKFMTFWLSICAILPIFKFLGWSWRHEIVPQALEGLERLHLRYVFAAATRPRRVPWIPEGHHLSQRSVASKTALSRRKQGSTGVWWPQGPVLP